MPDETETIPTVHQAWLRVMADVGAISKQEKANAGSYSYAFRGVETTVNHVQPILIKHGVTVVPIGMSVETYEFTNARDRREEMARVTTRWLVTGPAGDSFTMESLGSASDTSDKAPIQAVSVSQRIALLVGLQIPTAAGEDEPDNHHTERMDPAEAAARDDAAKALGWQDAAQRQAVWDAVKAADAQVPQEARKAVIGPWAKEAGLSFEAFSVAMSEEWRAKIAEATSSASEEPPPATSSPAASPSETPAASTPAKSSAPSDDGKPAFDPQAAFADLTEKSRMLTSKDAVELEKWLEENKILTPEELTRDLAREWFARLSDVLGAQVSGASAPPRQWKSAAERKRTWASLFDRMNALPEMLSISDWFDQSGYTEGDLTPAESEEWLAQIIEAEMSAEEPF